MMKNKTLDYLEEFKTTSDDYFEIRSMLPQQIMRVLWDGFSVAVDHALLTKIYSDIKMAAQMYSSLIDVAVDLPELQADYWIGRADDYLPDFWCVWMKWIEQEQTKERVLQ